MIPPPPFGSSILCHMTLLQVLEKKNIEKSQLLPEQWEWINELQVARKGNLYKKNWTLVIINYWGSALLYLRNLQTRKRAAAAVSNWGWRKVPQDQKK